MTDPPPKATAGARSGKVPDPEGQGDTSMRGMGPRAPGTPRHAPEAGPAGVTRATALPHTFVQTRIGWLGVGCLRVGRYLVGGEWASPSRAGRRGRGRCRKRPYLRVPSGAGALGEHDVSWAAGHDREGPVALLAEPGGRDQPGLQRVGGARADAEGLAPSPGERARSERFERHAWPPAFAGCAPIVSRGRQSSARAPGRAGRPC